MRIASRTLEINVICCMEAPLDTSKSNQPLSSWWQPCRSVSSTSKTLMLTPMLQGCLNASHKVLQTEITQARCLLNPGIQFQMWHGCTIRQLQKGPTSYFMMAAL